MIMISLVPSSLVERTSDRTASSSITVPKFLIMSTSAWARPLFSLCLGVPVLPVSGVIAPAAWPGLPAARASGQDQAHGGGRDRREEELERAGPPGDASDRARGLAWPAGGPSLRPGPGTRGWARPQSAGAGACRL